MAISRKRVHVAAAAVAAASTFYRFIGYVYGTYAFGGAAAVSIYFSVRAHLKNIYDDGYNVRHVHR